MLGLQPWHTYEPVQGMYCGVKFYGNIGPETRPTPDYKNVIFEVILSEPIEVFGQMRTVIEVWSNAKDDYVEIA